jgi:hypothetical protein
MRIALSVALLVACSPQPSDDDQQESMPDASVQQMMADAAVPPPTTQAHIEIRLNMPEYQGQTGNTLIRGGFVVSPDPKCPTTTVGNCVVSDCPQQDKATYANPGKLRFLTPYLGGAFGFEPGASFVYFYASSVPWAANEAINLEAAGMTVPAFTSSVTSPRTLDAGEGRDPFKTSPIVRSQAFVATWVPLAEKAKVVLRQGRDTAAGEYEVIVQCTGDGATGSMTIPAAALGKFIATASGGLKVTVNAYSMRETKSVVGDFGLSYRVLRSFDQTFFHEIQ